jgi:hypothetical protein
MDGLPYASPRVDADVVGTAGAESWAPPLGGFDRCGLESF